MPPIAIVLALTQPEIDGFQAALAEEDDFRILARSSFGEGMDAILSELEVAADVALVEVGGLEDLPHIRRLTESKKNLKVIVVGDLNDKTALEFMKSGARGYMSPSSAPPVLKKAIRVVHQGEVWVSRRTASQAFEEFARLHQERRPAGIGETLSKREKEVLQWVAQGSKNREIAQGLHISETTVKSHLSHIFEKLGVQDRLQAVLWLMKKNEL